MWLIYLAFGFKETCEDACTCEHVKMFVYVRIHGMWDVCACEILSASIQDTMY